MDNALINTLMLLTSPAVRLGYQRDGWEEFTLGIRVLPPSARRRKLEDYRHSLLDGGLHIERMMGP